MSESQPKDLPTHVVICLKFSGVYRWSRVREYGVGMVREVLVDDTISKPVHTLCLLRRLGCAARLLHYQSLFDAGY